MRIRPEVAQYVCILALSLTGTVLVAIAYAHVHGEITTVEQAQGYVDPMLQVGVLLGFVVMVAAVGGLGAAAIWAAVQLVRALRGKQS